MNRLAARSMCIMNNHENQHHFQSANHNGRSHCASIDQLRWRTVAASVRGVSHEKTGQPCQDANSWKVLPEGILVAAVADGAGSAALSEIGANIAVQIAVETVCTARNILQMLDDKSLRWLLMSAFKAARFEIEIEASVRQIAVRELATTLILIVAAPQWVAVAQVGDGVAIAGDAEGNIIPLTTPQFGEYINETIFLISPGALDQTQVHVWRGDTAYVAALSDGLQMLALNMQDNVPHAPFFKPLFRFMEHVTDENSATEQLVKFLTSPRVREKTTDDLTLLVARLS